ncbi:Isoleucine--tRNA ligase [Rathayibacter tanaceti]|uniref:Isoleucine--tRNA ligase n=1 Tax=Rathayibacter tanaceti TaxID=1671680 RepID=A0A162GU49_9MICO|nr:Isoleucine--tRNA ligase [Rathayibacter tanaceti]
MTYPLTPPTPHGAEPAEGSAFGLGVTPSPRFPEIEEHVLAYWKADDTFRESIRQREGAPEWVFYDGPPFANGLPHYGHLLTGYAKDVFPRFETMRGKQVHRRFGWDTHGLPAELEAERQLGITDKSQIEEMGVAAFNAAAKESVLRYTGEWQEYVTRQARWVDFDDDYKTLDPSFMESVIWAFKQLYDKGLAYEGHRVLPYCWRDQTPLSNHELRMDDDVYKARQDQTVTVTFPLVGETAEALQLTAVRALAWTTTPWTLPTNMALAVGPDIEYAVVPAGPDGAADGRGEPEERELSAEYLLAIDQSAPTRRTSAIRTRSRPWPPSRAPTAAPSWRGSATTACGTTTPTPRPGARRTRGESSSPTTSPRARARASCTRPLPTARTTRRCARRRASP